MFLGIWNWENITYSRLLNSKAESLTPSQKKLLNYILANDEETVFLTIQDIENITETMNQVPIDYFRKFVDAINSAKRVVSVGLRSAHSLAVFMGMALEFLQRDVYFGNENSHGPGTRFK
jgi:DNA-binding MurR/RpiR family transcriptional regulator